jgi:hypothetical protein
MDLFDDYEDEMDAVTPEQMEAVLSGRVPGDPAAARAAALVEDLRDALLEEPSPEATRAHLAAMVAAAEEMVPIRSRRSAMPDVTRRRIGGVVLAATLMMGGAVAAAVTQQEPAEQAFEEAWANVGRGPEVAAEASVHGKAVSAVAHDPTLEGCEKGQAVAAVASSKAAEHPQDDADRLDPCAQANDGNGNGDDASAFGKSIAEQAQADGEAFGQETSTKAKEDGEAFGQETADAASRGKSGDGNETGGGDEAGLTTAGEVSGGASAGGGPPDGIPGA